MNSNETQSLRSLPIRVEMIGLTCTCGMIFTMPEAVFEIRQREGKPITCPNGHRRVYPGDETPKVDDDRLRELHAREQAEARATDGRRKGVA